MIIDRLFNKIQKMQDGNKFLSKATIKNPQIEDIT